MKNKTDNKNTEIVRLDKWLWAARFFKTRSLARDMVQSGKVQYNGQRAKASRSVELGATIVLPAGFDSKEVIVEGLSDKRVSAPQAQLLYAETEKSIAQREKNAEARKLSAFHSPRPETRPDKKQRRKIIQFKQQ
ncbi:MULTISPECIES: ribosome-associated heat shock protein Hsp15 [Alteromonadaceae]|uniref:ribosome-associated heat shock protein Hsp15 n=1 Tax=Alteromonadaceae TaxID=72275 RepID=UPI001C091E4E|nr:MULTISPECIES: ribosome-associated heat shock protein Hsp15 [Aliiglaciecola]MBU2877534.1 ribosome-associated heat shock protein Hsp15 [Aliiglaciecola lipolytica]MDO6711114.1 ribosome-associated heat shock protein Hsp15 [Aliiglaciecola sp. 2_MG-2023]MDO6752028.1 ribosome-associated heat shock protein Hsp15 [Aliiglaciecola sp. 1_MG-2023]